MLKLCPALNCIAHVLPDKLLCAAHWARVPRDLQLAVYRSYANYKKARKPNMRLAAARALREAQRRAIESIRQHKKASA